MGIEKNPADFLPSDVEAVVASEWNYAARYNRQSEPRAILLAGQPGAGKTVLSSMLNKLLCGNVYFINADEYRRFHPNYKELYARYLQYYQARRPVWIGFCTDDQWVFWCGDGAADP